MAEATQAPAKKAGKSSLIVRVLLIVALVLVAGVFIRWSMLTRELSRGIDLFEDAKYQEARAVLVEVERHPLARIRIKPVAYAAIAKIDAELASDVAERERSVGAYEAAIQRLEAVRKLDGISEGERASIEAKIKEYTESAQRLKGAGAKP